ncbi:hypothetical protein GCM10009738_84560 [Kitasatospora viridis]
MAEMLRAVHSSRKGRSRSGFNDFGKGMVALLTVSGQGASPSRGCGTVGVGERQAVTRNRRR